MLYLFFTKDKLFLKCLYKRAIGKALIKLWDVEKTKTKTKIKIRKATRKIILKKKKIIKN